MCPRHSHRALSQHRHQCTHRCRQDHDHRTHPVLHRRVAQDRRSARRRRDHGLDGAGARARHHHHFRGDNLFLEGDGRQLSAAPHQHHRHARPRGFHHRSRALDARARRRVHGLRRRWRRAAAIGNRVAPGQQVQGAAPGIRQQDGPPGRGLLQVLRADAHAAQGQPGADPDPDRRGGKVRGHHRSGQDEGDLLGRRDAGHQIRASRNSRPTWSKRPRSGARRWSRRRPRPTKS